MKKSLGVAFIVSTLLLVGCCSASHSSKPWEYKIVSGNSHWELENRINLAVKEGFQLDYFQADANRIPFAVMRKHRE